MAFRDYEKPDEIEDIIGEYMRKIEEVLPQYFCFPNYSKEVDYAVDALAYRVLNNEVWCGPIGRQVESVEYETEVLQLLELGMKDDPSDLSNGSGEDEEALKMLWQIRDEMTGDLGAMQPTSIRDYDSNDAAIDYEMKMEMW